MADKEYLRIKDFIRREYDDLNYQERIIELEERIQILERQKKWLKIFTWFFAIAFFLTLLIIFLQGFSVWGFNLETSTINILAGAIIAEVVGLLGTAVTWLYSQRK